MCVRVHSRAARRLCHLHNDVRLLARARVCVCVCVCVRALGAVLFNAALGLTSTVVVHNPSGTCRDKRSLLKSEGKKDTHSTDEGCFSRGRGR
jgi:hypothetical protein